MNLKMLRYIIGQLLIAEGALMVLPLITMLCYGEFGNLYAFLIPMAAFCTAMLTKRILWIFLRLMRREQYGKDMKL